MEPEYAILLISSILLVFLFFLIWKLLKNKKNSEINQPLTHSIQEEQLKITTCEIIEEIKSVPVEILKILPKTKVTKNFLYLNCYSFQGGKAKPVKISVTSYNILCQKFLNIRKDKRTMNEKCRLSLILKELLSLNSDIICLQEVDSSLIVNHLQLFFQQNGYSFCKGKNEGSTFYNLIAYRSNRFNYISQKNLDLSFKEYPHVFIGNRGVFRLELRIKANNKNLVIYNSHLPWRPHLELFKCMTLGKIYEDLYKNLRTDKVLITGDLNSLPNSLVMKLVYSNQNKEFFFQNFIQQHLNKVALNSSSIDPNVQYLNQILRDSKDRVNFNYYLNMIHEINSKFGFKSAYENYMNLINFKENTENYEITHPEFTHMGRNSNSNIDYIIYNKSFVLKKILNLPKLTGTKKEKFFPSKKFPSDHIKIYAEFEISE